MKKSSIGSQADFIEFLKSQTRLHGNGATPAQTAALMPLITALAEDAPGWKIGALTWEYAFASLNRRDVADTIGQAHNIHRRQDTRRKREEWILATVEALGWSAPLTTGQRGKLWRLYKPVAYKRRSKNKPEPKRKDMFDPDLRRLRLA